MGNIKSVLSANVDLFERSGLLDIMDVVSDPFTTTETKYNSVDVSISGTAGSGSFKAKVLVGSDIDNVLNSKRGMTSEFYPFTVNGDFFKALSACDDLIKMFGSLNATMTVASTEVETQPNFSREAGASEKMTRTFILKGRWDVEPNFISA